jgi:hypothetical protein
MLCFRFHPLAITVLAFVSAGWNPTAALPDELQKRGLFDNTILVISADHRAPASHAARRIS